jgi:hypothetical protein
MATQAVVKNLLPARKPLAWAFLFTLLHLLLNGTAAAQLAASKALKLGIESARQCFQLGDTAEIKIALHDANDQAVVAPQDLTITVKARMDTGLVEQKEITIKAGTSAQTLRLPVNKTGMMYVWAKHKELLDGGIDVLVKPPKPQLPQGVLRVPPKAMPTPQPKPLLTLRYSPQRRFLADGKDRATIQAFLLNADEIMAEDIRVRLFNSAGKMEPQLLEILKGQDVGTTTLAANEVGIVTVEYVSATPPTELQGEKKLQIPFAPPITRLEFKASPPIITLVDKTELVLRLLDENAKPFPTDESRLISLTLEVGRGEIEKREITITPNMFEGRTTFSPTWRGQVDISASTPNLPTIHIEKLTVSLPTLLLILSALGGLIGGVIAFWVSKGSKWWRILIGLIAGFVLYWAFIFGVLTVLPRAAVLNPLSAFILSTLGGWLGTEVFTQILKRFGLVT